MKVKRYVLGWTIIAATCCLCHVAVATTDEIEVGVTAVSVIDTIGKPPVSPARNLETGLEVFFHEKISTDKSGRAQLLFRDGTSLTVGASSEMTIDEYVFDPDSGTGEMVINISKGVFRLVGGKISKNTPVIFNSPSATVAVRGGIAYVKETTVGLEAGLLYGTELSVTIAATGLSSRTSQAGKAFNVKLGQTTAPQAEKIKPETLAQDLAALEKPVDKAPTPADEPPQDTDNTAPDTAQSQESAPETESSGTAKAEPATQPQGDPDSPSDEPTQEQGLAQPEPGEQGEFSQEGQPAGETELARVESGSEKTLPETGKPVSRTVSENQERLAPLPLPESGEALVMVDSTGAPIPSEPGKRPGSEMKPENLPTAGMDMTVSPPIPVDQPAGMSGSLAPAMPAPSLGLGSASNLPKMSMADLPTPTLGRKLEIS
ncbi:MAG: FecR domain-containing protein, partial [Arenicellales bacterium]|nr:FecR domain-containing protein [Arenicellales bacterium]